MNEYYVTGTISQVSPICFTSSGIAVRNFVLDTDDKNKKSLSSQLKVSAFKEVAEQINEYNVGTKLMVKGYIKDNNYIKDDKTYYTPELIAESIYRLMWGEDGTIHKRD